jgi:hypothetical protein
VGTTLRSRRLPLAGRRLGVVGAGAAGAALAAAALAAPLAGFCSASLGSAILCSEGKLAGSASYLAPAFPPSPPCLLLGRGPLATGDGLPSPTLGAGIRLGALPVHRQIAPVAHSTIASDLRQPLDIELNLAA